MKRAFSLMEVIIAITMLSVVMIALLEVKSENIFLVKKADEKEKLNDYITLAINLDETDDRNQYIFLDRQIRFDNDNLRKELKVVKIKQKDEKIDSQLVKNDSRDLNITTYSTSYSIDNEIKKNIYTFKIEL